MAKRMSQSQGKEMNASNSIGSGPSEEDIRLRAYQRYVERGSEHGRDFDDWLIAEQELKRKRSAIMNKQ
jgi:hypothetical protein